MEFGFKNREVCVIVDLRKYYISWFMMEFENIEDFVRQRVIEYMQICGLTAYQLSECIGIPRSSISYYLTGKVKPGLFFIEKFCTLLAISQAEFYEPYDRAMSLKGGSPRPQLTIRPAGHHSKYDHGLVYDPHKVLQ